MGAPKLSVVFRSTTPPDEERDRQIAFQNWLNSTETGYLECRNGGHVKRGLTDPGTSLEVRQGQCYVQAPCPRCGTVMHSVVGVRDGYLEGPHTRTSYEYPDGYLLPKEATGAGGHAMDRDGRAAVRLEVLDRAFRAKGTSLAKETAAASRRDSAARARAAKSAKKSSA